MPQAIFVIHGQTVPKELTITGLVKPAQSTGKGRFSGPIVANDANYLSLCCCKADVVQNDPLLIVKGYIVKFAAGEHDANQSLEGPFVLGYPPIAAEMLPA